MGAGRGDVEVQALGPRVQRVAALGVASVGIDGGCGGRGALAAVGGDGEGGQEGVEGVDGDAEAARGEEVGVGGVEVGLDDIGGAQGGGCGRGR